ncbi:MAG TPA: transglycosylase SLT domain-containing protein [Gemmatimonadaceae bacterium]|nr:transglycosylase SLT domain-containing protein [Gemmatimonadaceae bacterium]
MQTPADPEFRETEIDVHAPEDRRNSAGNVYTNVRRRASERPPLTKWQLRAKTVGHGLVASILLVAGTVWTLNQQKPKFVKPGELLRLPVSMVVAPPPISEQVFRVSSVIRRYTKDTVHANKIATALIREGGKRNLDPALLIGLLIAENAKFEVNAKSNVNATGLMQVMPFHRGKWKQCPSRDLADIDSNICYGTSILADFVKRSPNLERALLRYNGCVRGTNTPRCHTYSGKVLRYADKAASQMLSAPFTPPSSE